MKYDIIKQISSGSFGTIYEVMVEHEEDGVTTSKCVLKELTRIDPLSKERFEREIKILPELNHPNIVNILYWNIGGDPPQISAILHYGILKRRIPTKIYG